jgi:hypothetical protein
MPKTSKVTVGGREYIVSEKYAGIAEKWRKHLRESSVYRTFLSIDGAIEQITYIIDEGLDNLKANRVTALAQTVPLVVMALVDSMDEINSLIFDYIPEMEADHDWIMENAYNSELVDVFVEVLKINFPILGALELIRGLRAPGISTNLPSTNGVIGTKRPTARSKSR